MPNWMQMRITERASLIFWPFSAVACAVVVAAVCGMQWICVIIEMLLANVARDRQRIVASSSSSSSLQLQLKPVFTFTRQHDFLLPVNCANFVSLRMFFIFAVEFRLLHAATVTLVLCLLLSILLSTRLHSVFCVPGRLYSRQQPLALWHIIDTWPGHKAKCIDIHIPTAIHIHIHMHMHIHSQLGSQHAGP